MIIKRLNLKAFGFFCDFELSLGDNGNFNLVYGLNENGKTTVLRAIRDFFYGIPQRSPDAYFHSPDKLRIEAVLRDSSGRQFKLVRRKGTKNTLLDAENNRVEEKFLLQYLGSVNRDSFSLMFGMDHRSLRKGGEDLLKRQGALGETLFAAASGIDGLQEFFGELEKEATDLFKPSGSRPPVNAGLMRFREIKKRTGELSLAPRKWEELERRYLAEKQQVEQLKVAEKELTAQQTHLERLNSTLPLLAQHKKHLEEIELLGDIPYLTPSFTAERLERLNKRLAAATLKERAKNDLEELSEELNKVTVCEELLAQSGNISALQERLDTYRGYAADIPVLEGERRELREEALSLLLQLNPSFSELEQADSLRLPLACVEELRQLSKEHPLLWHNFTSAKKQAGELECSLEKQEKEKEKAGPLKATSALGKTLNRARKKGDLEKTLKEKSSAAATLGNKLMSKLDSLGLWSGTFEELLSLPLPLAETVRAIEKNYQLTGDQDIRINERMGEEEVKLAAYREQLVAEELGEDVPTEEKLEETRKHRQYGWHLVRRAWLEGRRDEEMERAYDAELPLAAAYERSVVKADAAADRLRYEAGRVERKTLLLAEMEKCRRKIGELSLEKATVAKQGRELQEKWLQTWGETGINPLTPSEMLSWLERCREIIDELHLLNEHRQSQTEIEQEIKNSREEIAVRLQELDEPGPGAQESLEMLLDRAQEAGDKYQAAANRLKSLEDKCKDLAEKLAASRRQKEEAEESLAAWGKRWSALLKSAELPGQTTPDAVLAYLDKLGTLFNKLAEMRRKQAELHKMKDYSTDFASRLRVLLDKLAPDLSRLPVDQAASQLQARADKARQDKGRRENLKKQLAKAEEMRKNAEQDMEEINIRMQELIKQARCREEAELPAMEEKSGRLLRLKESVEGLENQLLALGRGLPLEKIVEEAAGVNGDVLPGELLEAAQALEKNRQAQDALNQGFGVTRKEYEEKIEGAYMEAAEAAEEAQGVLAEVRLLTEQYLRLRLASIVLRRGIERYREENQSPIVSQAGKLFARLTRGSFSGLKIDFDEKDNPVILGLRPSGELLAVDGMSDGTLDQFYLSLRLASLERYLEQNEPLPFILDDLLVNFDDRRAEETLKVLGEFASKTQVIFFTHHQGFVDMVKKIIPGYREITLSQ